MLTPTGPDIVDSTVDIGVANLVQTGKGHFTKAAVTQRSHGRIPAADAQCFSTSNKLAGRWVVDGILRLAVERTYGWFFAAVQNEPAAVGQDEHGVNEHVPGNR